MPVRPELQTRLPNSPGALATLCRLLADERVTIVALSLEAQGQLRLIVDNHARAAAVLRERRYQVHERDAIVASVGVGPGGFAAALSLLAGAGVNVEYAYAGEVRNLPSLLVIGVADAMRAAAAAGI